MSDMKFITPQMIRHLEAAKKATLQEHPERIEYLHSCFCQIGIPRAKPKGNTFEHSVGNYSILMKAGELFDGIKQTWHEQPLPYGVIPRLILIYISSYAKTHKTRNVEVGKTMAEFLARIGVNNTGGRRGGITNFKNQAKALAACYISIGFLDEYNRSSTIKTQIIDGSSWNQFDLWAAGNGNQMQLWQNEIIMSEEFYQSVQLHSVPLDGNAIAGLHNNALALDIYTYLVHRLYRLNNPLILSWESLRQQFCPNYKEVSNSFKQTFKMSLQKAVNVYPDAKVEVINGGVKFSPSKRAIEARVII